MTKQLKTVGVGNLPFTAPAMGAIVTHRTSGLRAEVVGVRQYASGCEHFFLEYMGTNKNGDPFDSDWVDSYIVNCEKPLPPTPPCPILGRTGTDTITGYKGQVIAVVYAADGYSPNIVLQAPMQKGKDFPPMPLSTSAIHVQLDPDKNVTARKKGTKATDTSLGKGSPVFMSR